uniref:Kri1-like C-terminal domain-containing protein n=1 Tax=Hyaloperonospora arabidopsidis (strain Emoy2) TaxID=559515 RepID=M4BY72_HYAAE
MGSSRSRKSSKTSSQASEIPRSTSPEVSLHVNEKYAQAYEQRKRKEELSALERRGLYAQDNDAEESDSETEDEDGEELTQELDTDIRKTLKLIRKKDPVIYDSSIAFFKPQEDTEKDVVDSTKHSKKASSAPLHYKDLVRQQAIAGDVSGSDEEDEMEGVQTYAEEQAEIKKDFLSSLRKEEHKEGSEEEGDSLDGGLFTMRKKGDGELDPENKVYDESTFRTKLQKDELDPEKFLEHYLSSEGWKDKTAVLPHYDEIVKEDEEDAEALEKAEEFEHTYNFRFEEQGSSVIQTHARHIDDTVRREDDLRKRKRAERKARKAYERQKKELELRRLKNLKQAEIEQKLKKVARLMGKEEGTIGLKAEDLEGEFDPDEHDKRMRTIFDEQYYDEDSTDMEKPSCDEDEDKELLAGLPTDPEEEEEQDGGEAKKEDEEELMPEDEAGQDEKEEALPKKMTLEEMRHRKQEYLDELYSLDYEDLIGDIKCRFKYRRVQSNDFGLTADEIMVANDKELQQLVALKRMAPYADTEYSVDRRLLKNFKKSVQETREENRRRKPKEETRDSSKIQSGEVEQPKKKRKRSKPKKTIEEEAMPGEDEATLDEGSVIQGKKAKTEKPEPVVAKTADESEKKKKRRNKKKKSSDQNVFASTGLPSSRLESYKLVKAAKK